MDENYFKVENSYPFDTGKGIARISEKMAQNCGLKRNKFS